MFSFTSLLFPTNLKSSATTSAICTIGGLIVSLGFSFYINNFSNYSKIYGGLGAVIILITWLYITSIIFITGGEINSVIGIRRGNLKIK